MLYTKFYRFSDLDANREALNNKMMEYLLSFEALEKEERLRLSSLNDISIESKRYYKRVARKSRCLGNKFSNIIHEFLSFFSMEIKRLIIIRTTNFPRDYISDLVRFDKCIYRGLKRANKERISLASKSSKSLIFILPHYNVYFIVTAAYHATGIFLSKMQRRNLRPFLNLKTLDLYRYISTGFSKDDVNEINTAFKIFVTLDKRMTFYKENEYDDFVKLMQSIYYQLLTVYSYYALDSIKTYKCRYGVGQSFHPRLRDYNLYSQSNKLTGAQTSRQSNSFSYT